MKIFAFTDIHSDEKILRDNIKKIKKQKPALVIVTGDISIFDMGLEYVLSELGKLDVPVLLIHGNHESYSKFASLIKKYKNLVDLHKKSYSKDGFIFLGYGGGGFAIVDPDFDRASKKLEGIMKKLQCPEFLILIYWMLNLRRGVTIGEKL